MSSRFSLGVRCGTPQAATTLFIRVVGLVLASLGVEYNAPRDILRFAEVFCFLPERPGKTNLGQVAFGQLVFLVPGRGAHPGRCNSFSEVGWFGSRVPGCTVRPVIFCKEIYQRSDEQKERKTPHAISYRRNIMIA